MSDSRYRVEPFGRDCLGNISGYRVVGKGEFGDAVFINSGEFVGNIYEEGSFERAKAAAEKCAAEMNAPDEQVSA